MKSISLKLDENKVVNTSAWLVSVIKFANKIKFLDSFRSFNLRMKQVTYTNLNKIQTLVTSIAMGCNYTNDINNKLVPDTLAAKILGMDRFPDQSQINRFLNRFDETNIDQLEYIHHGIFMKNSLSLGSKEDIVVDFDMTGLVAGGKTYELAEKGYFPRKRGEKGYQVSATFIQNTSETISLHLDPENTVSTNRFDDLLKSTILKLQNPVKENRVIIRTDSNYGSYENVKTLQNSGVKFITKGFSTKQSKNLSKDITKDAWKKINI